MIDELRLYRRALADEEVANACGRYRRPPRLVPLPFAHLRFRVNGVEQQVATDLELFSPVRDRVRAAELILRDAVGNTVAKSVIDTFDNYRATGLLTNVPLDWGRYGLTARFLDVTGAELGREQAFRERVKPTWYGTNLGVHDTVLPGWTPMRVQNRTVQLALKSVTYAGSGLPGQIVANGKEILAEPFRVVARAQGKPLAFIVRPDAFRVDKATDVQVITVGSSIWSTSTLKKPRSGAPIFVGSGCICWANWLRSSWSSSTSFAFVFFMSFIVTSMVKFLCFMICLDYTKNFPPSL